VSADKLRLLRELALDRPMMGWPLRVYAYLLQELDQVEFREVKSLVVARSLRLDDSNARKLLRILVARGYLEVQGSSGQIARYRLADRSNAKAVA
jgi:DNA-binding IclR family transcriptional regulator